MMLLSVPVVVWGCKSDPTVSSGAGVPSKLVATPARVFVNQAGSEVVTVTSVDEEGRTVPTTFTLTPPTDAGITVTLDTTQQLIYNSEGVAVAPTGTATARYIVAATTFTSSSFTVTSAEGKTITIQVDATPASLPATFSKTAINLGDTITITAPAGTFFRTNADTLLASMVTFASGIKPIVVSVSADSNTIRIVPGPNDAGVATITNLGVRYNNQLRFTAPTTTGVTSTPAIVSAGTVSPTTSALSQTITITAPPGTGTRFLPGTSKVFFADNTDLAKNVVVSADSQSISFIAPPNRTAVKPSVTNVINTKLPQARFQQTLTTTNALTTPAVTAFVGGVLSTTTPTAGQQVTLTGNTNFKMAPSATVTIGGRQATTIGVSADSLVLTFVPPTGSTGAVVLTGTVAGGFALSALPTGLSLTAGTGAIPAIAGTDAFATAPVITLTPGKATGIVSGAPLAFNGPGALAPFNGQVFQITTTTANQQIKFDLWASNGADMGVYVYRSNFTVLGTSGASIVDANGSGAGNAESGTITFPTVGVYYLDVLSFDPDPAAFGLTVTP
jgi:hypothetical protein